MTHPVLKPTVKNIISLWFGVATPLRAYKIRSNPDLWEACQQVHAQFVPPSRASSVASYRKSDQVAFARAVIRQVDQLAVYQ